MFKRILATFMTICFSATLVGPYANAATLPSMPIPGTMVNLSPAFEPALIKGLTIHKDNPFLFDFIVDTGKSGLIGEELKQEGDRLVKYFFACLTIPEKDLWVNLSPYEKDRMVPEALGQTALGRDLLAQDYILKQLTASLIYPEKDLGKEFWSRIYAKAQQMYGSTTQIPVNTFNKVWIVADKASVFEHGQTAFVVNGHLKVMMEEDYLATSKHTNVGAGLPGPMAKGGETPPLRDNQFGSAIIRDLILPEIEREVNTGKNFAMLRQIFYSQVLATWFKRNLKEALINQVYANKTTVKGIDQNDSKVNEAIYQQYLKAYKKGVFNYIKEEIVGVGSKPTEDRAGLPAGQAGLEPAPTVARKYFSGGYDSSKLRIDPARTIPAETRLGDYAMKVALNLNDAAVVINAGQFADRLVQQIEKGDRTVQITLINQAGARKPETISLSALRAVASSSSNLVNILDGRVTFTFDAFMNNQSVEIQEKDLFPDAAMTITREREVKSIKLNGSTYTDKAFIKNYQNLLKQMKALLEQIDINDNLSIDWERLRTQGNRRAYFNFSVSGEYFFLHLLDNYDVTSFSKKQWSDIVADFKAATYGVVLEKDSIEGGNPFAYSLNLQMPYPKSEKGDAVKERFKKVAISLLGRVQRRLESLENNFDKNGRVKTYGFNVSRVAGRLNTSFPRSISDGDARFYIESADDGSIEMDWNQVLEIEIGSIRYQTPTGQPEGAINLIKYFKKLGVFPKSGDDIFVVSKSDAAMTGAELLSDESVLQEAVRILGGRSIKVSLAEVKEIAEKAKTETSRTKAIVENRFTELLAGHVHQNFSVIQSLLRPVLFPKIESGIGGASATLPATLFGYNLFENKTAAEKAIVQWREEVEGWFTAGRTSSRGFLRDELKKLQAYRDSLRGLVGSLPAQWPQGKILVITGSGVAVDYPFRYIFLGREELKKARYLSRASLKAFPDAAMTVADIRQKMEVFLQQKALQESTVLNVKEFSKGIYVSVVAKKGRTTSLLSDEELKKNLRDVIPEGAEILDLTNDSVGFDFTILRQVEGNKPDVVMTVQEKSQRIFTVNKGRDIRAGYALGVFTKDVHLSPETASAFKPFGSYINSRSPRVKSDEISLSWLSGMGGDNYSLVMNEQGFNLFFTALSEKNPKEAEKLFQNLTKPDAAMAGKTYLKINDMYDQEKKKTGSIIGKTFVIELKSGRKETIQITSMSPNDLQGIGTSSQIRASDFKKATLVADHAALSEMLEESFTRGGIDLNADNMGMKITKDTQGGVQVTIDPAMIEQIKAKGIWSANPVIIQITPITPAQIRPLLGLDLPKQENTQLAKV